ncbi:MAG: hypothetical protein ABIK36_21035 [Pseudomonadota bacterium]
MIWLVRLSTLLVSVIATSVLFIQQPSAAENETIRSVVAAINTASGQTRLGLVKGLFRTKQGSNEFRFEVPKEMSSTLKFDFDNGVLLSASWAFQESIFVEVRSGGKCVRLEVKRLEYEEGGFLSGESDQTIVPTGPCRESEPLSRLGDYLRLSTEAADFFRGHAFVAFDRLEKCTNSNCSATTAGLPIRRADFYNASSGPGLAVSLRPQSTIILPRSSYLVIGARAALSVRNLSYDLESDSGEASLEELNLMLSDGVIASGATILRIARGSELTANEFLIEKQDGVVTIDGGLLTGALGERTTVALSNSADKTSLLAIQSASATLTGIHYRADNRGASLAILRGQLGVRVEKAELWLTDRNSLRTGYTSLDLTLGCPPTTPDAECRPVEWSGGDVNVSGVITNFSTALVGGQFNITNVGDVKLLSGQVVADRLLIDTSDAHSPITGTVNRFEAVLHAQDLAFDDATSARLATANVSAHELVYRKGETLPVGRVTIDGELARVEGGDLKEVAFVAGAKFEIVVERTAGDDPGIVDGRIDGSINFSMTGGNGGSLLVGVRDLRYYRGVGDGMLELVVTEAKYTFDTPADRRNFTKFPLRAEIDVKSIRLEPTLGQPLRLGPTRMRSNGRKWKIDPVIGLTYDIRLPIAQQELVYAPIKDTVVKSTICAPKVMLLSQTQQITGKIDVFAADTGSGVRIYDNKVVPGIVSQVEERGCDVVAKMVCAAVGGAFGGAIGAVALAAVCGQNLEEEKAKLSDKIRDESIKKVAEAEFRFGL